MPIPKLHGETEFIIARAMVDELAAYLKSDVLFWPLAPNNPLGDKMPQLTIGGLLEAQVRAEAAADELSADQRAALNAIKQQHDRIRADQPVAYEQRAVREINSRLNTWATFMDDASRRPNDLAYYAHEVRTRAKIQLLAQALGAALPAAEKRRINELDARLYEMWEPGAFIWDPRLQGAFPPDSCWWLYGRWPE